MKLLRRAIFPLFVFVVAAASSARADTYHLADFTGSLNGGSANVRAPFNSVITQGGPVSGHFVYDDLLVPAAGVVNVFFTSNPDIGSIAPATAFFLDLGGGITFDLSSPTAGPPAIQYNNGEFNGFFFVSDFLFLGNPYRFDNQGRTFKIRALVNGAPSGSNLVNGTIRIGNSNLAIQDYTTGETQAAEPIPEPASLFLLAAGIAGAAVRGRARRREK